MRHRNQLRATISPQNFPINQCIYRASTTVRAHISVDNVRARTGTVIVECIFSLSIAAVGLLLVSMYSCCLFFFSRARSFRCCFLSCGIFCIFAHRFTNNLSNMNPLNIHVMWTYANDVVVRNAKLGAALFVYHTLTEQKSFLPSFRSSFRCFEFYRASAPW